MDRQETLARILETGVVAVVRLSSPGALIKVAEAIEAGGVRAIEFTMTTPGAIDALAEASAALGDRAVLGAGTVLDGAAARAAIEAGARFLVAPTISHQMIEIGRRAGAVVIPGGYSPTEILAAWDLGADLVKVFPATGLGPGYFRDVLAPLPNVRLMPSGGVDLSNAGAFVEAGAQAVAVGSSLVDPSAVARGDFGVLTERARAFRDVVRDARARVASGRVAGRAAAPAGG
jgi:2-dehydro-3-deoxyphosphogluconate aldolase/(4S)-4-hydroxy-2-oxoglutarate aldolase